MPKFSSDKGKRFERYIRSQLSKAAGVEFFRVPRSGGLVTSLPILKEELGIYANSFKGDLFASGLAFLLELKNRSSEVKLSHLIDGYGSIYKWWEQAVEEAGDLLMPMVIFNTASHNKYCIVDKDGFSVLKPKLYSEVINEKYHVFVIPFDHLINTDLHKKLFIKNIKNVPSKYQKTFNERMNNEV